jgi:hypothetical protein
VAFAQEEEIQAALRKAGVPPFFQELTDASHGFKNRVLDERVRRSPGCFRIHTVTSASIFQASID